MKLPLDWTQEKLRTLVKIDQKTLGKKTPLDFTFRYISLADVNNGKVSQNLPHIIFAKAPSRARRIVSQGDILFATVRPNLEGYCCFNEPVNDLIASTGFAVLSPKILSDTEYIYQYLYSNTIKSQIHAMVVGSNYPALNSSDVANLKIVIPNSALERKAIASLLSVWNEAIEKTERLIAAKERQYRWLSNKLLFGRNFTLTNSVRTKWFKIPGHWQLKTIKDIATEVKITNETKSNIPVLSCTKYDGLVDSLKYFDKKIYSDDTSNYKVVRKGHFAYATNHIEEGSIGYQDIYPEGLVSPMYTVFKTNNRIYDGYLYKLLKTEIFRHMFEVNTSASVNRRGSLRWNQFSKLPIPFPPIDEQKQIAEILNHAEKEMDFFKQINEKYKAQKRGLMQKLLTGKWRVKIEKGE